MGQAGRHSLRDLRPLRAVVPLSTTPLDRGRRDLSIGTKVGPIRPRVEELRPLGGGHGRQTGVALHDRVVENDYLGVVWRLLDNAVADSRSDFTSREPKPGRV